VWDLDVCVCCFEKRETNPPPFVFFSFGRGWQVVSGMATAERIVNPTPGNSNGVSQAAYTKGGNAWLLPQ
jgi:hypothetical protein